MLKLRRELVPLPEFRKNAGAIQIQMYVETTKYIQKRYLLKIMPELRPITTPELRAIAAELWAMTSAGKMDNYFKTLQTRIAGAGLKTLGSLRRHLLPFKVVFPLKAKIKWHLESLGIVEKPQDKMYCPMIAPFNFSKFTMFLSPLGETSPNGFMPLASRSFALH